MAMRVGYLLSPQRLRLGRMGGEQAQVGQDRNSWNAFSSCCTINPTPTSAATAATPMTT